MSESAFWNAPGKHANDRQSYVQYLGPARVVPREDHRLVAERSDVGRGVVIIVYGVAIQVDAFRSRDAPVLCEVRIVGDNHDKVRAAVDLTDKLLMRRRS